MNDLVDMVNKHETRLVVVENKVVSLEKADERNNQIIETLSKSLNGIDTKLEIFMAQALAKSSVWEKITKNLLPIMFIIVSGLWSYHLYTENKIETMIQTHSVQVQAPVQK
jgi:hypothetical protein